MTWPEFAAGKVIDNRIWRAVRWPRDLSVSVATAVTCPAYLRQISSIIYTRLPLIQLFGAQQIIIIFINVSSGGNAPGARGATFARLQIRNGVINLGAGEDRTAYWSAVIWRSEISFCATVTAFEWELVIFCLVCYYGYDMNSL